MVCLNWRIVGSKNPFQTGAVNTPYSYITWFVRRVEPDDIDRAGWFADNNRRALTVYFNRTTIIVDTRTIGETAEKAVACAHQAR